MNSYEQKEYQLDKIKYKYHYDFYDIYDNIKEESMCVSDDILSYDYIGLKNVNTKIINFVNKCITVDIHEKKYYSDEEHHSEDDCS